MKNKTSRSAKIQLGIVGGGQLARMLSLEAAELGISVRILSEKEGDPAAQVCKKWLKGDPNSRKDVMDFCDGLDLLTFESEFYEMNAYFEAEQKALQIGLKSSSLFIFPSPECMQILQNRETQKNLLQQLQIPTAAFQRVRTKEELLQAWQQFPDGFVLKKCRGGYDGLGTYYCRSAKDLQKLQPLFPAEFIAESLVNFKRELAVTLVRSREKQVFALPLVETKQKDSRCDWVTGPVKHPQFSRLLKSLKSLMDHIDYVGVMSFEIFDLGSKLLINEIAPRVHNSAHYSQQALSRSQFMLHLLAGLGESLKPVELIAPQFCMLNLVGSTHDKVEIPMGLKGRLHWYGKSENRPGRKMGHLNYVGKSKAAILKLGLSERKKFKL